MRYVESERMCWDCFFREQADLSAKMSTCQTRHVGAVLVRDNRVVAQAFNGNLPGHVHCYDGGCDRCANSETTGQDLSVCTCVHAEQNLISFCAKEGHSSLGSTAYLQCNPCLDCFKLLVSAGVEEIVYSEKYISTYDLVAELALASNVTFRLYGCSCH